MPNYRFIDKVSAAANLTAEALAVGADGAKGIKALALGAANLKLFMNAAGTANEYANGIKIGTFSRDVAAASGSVEYTAVGFKPSVILLFVGIDGTYIDSKGMSNAVVNYTLSRQQTNVCQLISTAIYLQISAADYHLANVSSMDVDGFTLAWVKTGSPTGTAVGYYIAFR